MVWDWYSQCTSPVTGKCEIVTCMDPKEAKSSWAPRGTLIGQFACSGGGESDSSAHKREKPGEGGGLHLGTRANSSCGVASPGSEALCFTRGGYTDWWFHPGASVMGALPLEVRGTCTPFQSHVAFLGQADYHWSELWRQGTHAKFLHCSTEHSQGTSQNRQHIFVEPWPKSLSIQPTKHNNPELPWNLLGEGNPFPPATLGRVGQSMSHYMFQLCGWQPEAHSLLAGHSFKQDVSKVICLW